jgi:hypothetical protein
MDYVDPFFFFFVFFGTGVGDSIGDGIGVTEGKKVFSSDSIGVDATGGSGGPFTPHAKTKTNETSNRMRINTSAPNPTRSYRDPSLSEHTSSVPFE